MASCATPRLLLLALLALPAASAAAQDALPPDHPTIAFTAEYRLERNRGGRFEWGLRRLYLDRDLDRGGGRLRDELLNGDLDRATLLVDLDRGTALRFEPDDPDHAVSRQALGIDRERRLPAMAQGYEAVMRRLGPPRALGSLRIAGMECRRLLWQTVGETQEWCVSAQGIALLARRKAGAQETRIEATMLQAGRPDPALFALPPGFAAPPP
jgi:hypothetical protein